MEKLVALCKRRGFVFPGSELYGGLNGTWDLGPLGVLLAKNVKGEWWKSVVERREDVVGLDSSILHHPKVWEASGHVASFTDPLIECKMCHERFREDHKKQIEEHAKTHKDVTNYSSSEAKPSREVSSRQARTITDSIWTDVKQFNLMFKTYVGPIDNEENKTYLRPETAQGIFINFKNVLDSTRIKIPFGIAQIGKGFRNEITTGNFLFRVREFEMMELEYFTYPKQAEKDFEYWQKERINWFTNLGINTKNLRFREHEETERAHYATRSVDIEYDWPFMDWGELEGIANRTDYDLKQHSKKSHTDFSYF